MKEKIRLSDKNGIDIHVGDILYWNDKDTYFTVFEVPGGYAIESNPKSFGLYDPDDPFPVYESTDCIIHTRKFGSNWKYLFK